MARVKGPLGTSSGHVLSLNSWKKEYFSWAINFKYFDFFRQKPLISLKEKANIFIEAQIYLNNKSEVPLSPEKIY